MHRDPFVIRAAIPADGPRARDIVFPILLSYGITPEPEGLDADVMEFGSPGNGSLAELVADVSGEPVGLVSLSSKEDGIGWVSKLFVVPSYRGRGIGKALLARAVDASRARGHHRVGLRTRSIFLEAVALYEATGWKRGPDPDVSLGPDRTYWMELG